MRNANQALLRALDRQKRKHREKVLRLNEQVRVFWILCPCQLFESFFKMKTGNRNRYSIEIIRNCPLSDRRIAPGEKKRCVQRKLNQKLWKNDCHTMWYLRFIVHLLTIGSFFCDVFTLFLECIVIIAIACIFDNKQINRKQWGYFFHRYVAILWAFAIDYIQFVIVFILMISWLYNIFVWLDSVEILFCRKFFCSSRSLKMCLIHRAREWESAIDSRQKAAAQSCLRGRRSRRRWPTPSTITSATAMT